jgi:hypothetical protein
MLERMKKVVKVAKIMRAIAIVVEEKAIGVVLVVRQNISLTFTNNHLKIKIKRLSHFACDDDDFDYGNMDVTHLDVADFFADPDGKIDHLMGDDGVQK